MTTRRDGFTQSYVGVPKPMKIVSSTGRCDDYQDKETDFISGSPFPGSKPLRFDKKGFLIA